MTTPDVLVRRATVEDLPKLVPLWQQEGLSSQAMEKRFKEFQVAESGDGLVGALGLQVTGTEGRLHSEVFVHPEQADSLRELLWERAQVLAKNYGLVRLWCQFSTPFWNHCGFQYADAAMAGKLPPGFSGDPHPWRFIQLRDEASSGVSIEKEFAVFREMEKARTERLFQQAKFLKGLAMFMVVAVFILLVFWLFAWFKARSHMPPR